MKINGNTVLKGDEDRHTGYNDPGYGELMVLGDDHAGTSVDTPLRSDAFEISDTEKKKKIAFHFRQIMETLGLDLNDDSLNGTPERVAKMYVDEIFYGLDPAKKPASTLFENKFGYREMLIERDIKVHSYCEHHFVPIIGKAHVAYISSGCVIGLSKINRIVDYFARRPQVQERLTMQIAEELKKVLETEDVAVVIDSEHMCVITRGVRDLNSSTVTASYHGKFREAGPREEFLRYISLNKETH
jgi:GTP cyclohydrolase I